MLTFLRNKADKECEINAKLEDQRDDLIEQINQTNHKNEKILASIKGRVFDCIAETVRL